MNCLNFSLEIQVQFGKLNNKTNTKHLENINPDAFLVQRNGGIIMNTSRFTITTVVENGYPHYKVYDNLTDNEIHCDLNELNETIWQLLGVQKGRVQYVL